MRVGFRTGARVGPHVGLGPPDVAGDPFAGIARDAASLVYFPENASQWTQFRSAAGLSIDNPDHLHLCQESSGNLADSIGSLTLSAVGTPAYQQNATGYTRKGVRASADGAAGDRFSAAGGVGPNPSTTSILWLIFVVMPATPAATRFFFGLNVTSATNSARLGHLVTSGLPRHQHNANNVDGASSLSTVSTTCALLFDRAGSRANAYTAAEKITNVFAATVNDGQKGFANAHLGVVVYSAIWTGAKAEAVTDGVLRSTIEAMGVPQAW